MAKDYKNIAANKKKRDSNPGLLRNMLPFITGLGLGLLITFGLYLSQKDGSYTPFQTKPGSTAPNQPAPGSQVNDQVAPVAIPVEQEPTPAPALKFDFYDELPNRKLSISEYVAEEKALEQPGVQDANSVYILQVGSFKQLEAADQVKAQLALIGVTADIQRVVINGQDTLYRVRVGPYSDQQKLNDARLRLQENKLEFMLLKLQADDPRVTDG
jgi:cell division protein FtsN